MTEESIVRIIVPMISGILAVLGSFVGNYALSLKKSRENAIKEAEHEQEQKDQLDMILREQQEIKKRLDIHNGYAEKFAKNNEQLAVFSERLNATNRAMDKLQKDIDYLKSGCCKA